MKTFALIVLAAMVFASCQKNESSSANGKAHMQIYLTDDPAHYEAVILDVRDIRVNYSSDTANGWVSLANVRPGSYDILQLANGHDTLLADADLNTGRVEQIRLVLGPDNFVKIGGQMIRLETPSAQQSGLKLNIHQDANEGILYQLVLDFDAARSIVRTGNGKYILKPTIRTTLRAAGGSIKGYVLPNSFPTAVFAIQGADTVAGTFTMSGAYLIRGLNAGSYNLAFVPGDSTYTIQTRNGIGVTTDHVTAVDTVLLHQ